MNEAWEVVAALAPPLGVGFLFFVAIRAIVHADRRERAAREHAAAQDADSSSKTPHEA